MLQAANFLLLDAAIMGPAIAEAFAFDASSHSLFQGSPEASLDGVAPHLFQYRYDSDFSRWFLSAGWGRAWGILIKAGCRTETLLAHLQQILHVKTATGRQYLFRYYDPRILRVFLATCTQHEIREFFGNGRIEYFIVEDSDPAFALRFRHENGVLRTERLEVRDLITARSIAERDWLQPPPEARLATTSHRAAPRWKPFD